MKKLLLAAAVLSLPLTAGCQCGQPQRPQVLVPPPEDTEPPWIQEVEIPDFPPIGPGTLLTAHISDDGGLHEVSLGFLHERTFNVYGEDADIQFTGEDLGEGFGTARIHAEDIAGNFTDLEISGLAVDLSPPDAKLLDAVVRRGEDSDIWVWVGDAFVLGRVTVTFGGASQTYEFGAGYPATFGSEWDQSMVNFPALSLPEGSGALHVTVEDAAGNSFEEDFDLLLDGTAPSVDIASPVPNEAVSGVLSVHASASDDTGGPVWISLSLGGTPIGTFVGPDAEVDIDTADFAAGEVVLSAIALDQAGNESEPFEVPLVLQ